MTVETNRVWDQYISICQDQFLKPVKIFSTVKTQFVFVLVKIYKIETFKLSLICDEILIKIGESVKTNQDFLDVLRLFKIYQDI